MLRGVAGDYTEITREHAQVVFPDPTRRRWAATLGAEFQSGDCHAGRYESSIVLAADPKAVHEEARQGLAPVAIDLLDKMRSGVTSFLRAGAALAYCGDPAAASAGEGHELIERLASMTVVSIEEAWPELFA